jgi:hypothetical protein
MAVEDFTLVNRIGATVYFVIWDLAMNTVWDSSDATFKPLASAVDPYLPAPAEDVFGSSVSTYRATQELDDVHAGDKRNFYVAAYKQTGAAPDATTDKPFGYLNIAIAQGELVGSGDGGEGGVGSGSVRVDQDYGGTNRLCYIINGHPVDNAEVKFFLFSDFDAGNRTVDFVIATSRTRADGTWERAVMLDPGDYVMEFHKQGVAGPDDFRLGVTVDPAESTLERLTDNPPQDPDGDNCVVEGLDAFGGDGTILVDENFGGPGALTYEDAQGVPITNAEILFFTAAGYAAGMRQSKDSVAASRQLASGAWQQAVKLDPGNYTIQFSKSGVAGPDTVNITVP